MDSQASKFAHTRTHPHLVVVKDVSIRQDTNKDFTRLEHWVQSSSHGHQQIVLCCVKVGHLEVPRCSKPIHQQLYVCWSIDHKRKWGGASKCMNDIWKACECLQGYDDFLCRSYQTYVSVNNIVLLVAQHSFMGNLIYWADRTYVGECRTASVICRIKWQMHFWASMGVHSSFLQKPFLSKERTKKNAHTHTYFSHKKENQKKATCLKKKQINKLIISKVGKYIINR